VVALGLFVAQGEMVEGVGQGFGETIEAGRIGFELAQAIGAGEGDRSHQVETFLGDGDQAGAAIARVGADDTEIQAPQFVDRLAQCRRVHVEAFSERCKSHVGAFGQRVEHSKLQAGNAVALFQFEMEGGDGGIEPHPGDQGGKGLLLHFSFMGRDESGALWRHRIFAARYYAGIEAAISSCRDASDVRPQPKSATEGILPWPAI
jgi:hypothetical protein